MRTLLDRLGEPEEIVAAAGDDLPPSGWGPPPWGGQVPQPAPRRQGTTLETAAVLMLTIGSLIPLVGWLVGVVLLWTSRRWRTGEKLLGTLVVPGGPGILLPLGLVGFGSNVCTIQVAPTPVPDPATPDTGFTPPPPAFETETCESSALLPTWLVVPLLLLALLGPVVVAVVLLRRARARAAAEEPELRASGTSPWGALEVSAVLVLAFGSFLVPFAGSLVGLALAWASPRWTLVEKVAATVLTLLPAGLVLLAFLGGPLVLPFGLFVAALLGLFGQLLAAGYLALVLSRRAVG